MVTPEEFERDLGRLDGFITDLRELLEEALMRRQDLFDGHHGSFEAAWVTVGPKFELVHEALRRQEIRDAVEHFGACGLTGPELTLKLDLYADAKRDYQRWAEEQGVPPPRRRGGLRRRLGRLWSRISAGAESVTKSAFARVLEIADVPLGSLGKVIDAAFASTPVYGMIYSTAVEGIKEFKDSAKHVAGRPES